MNSQTIESLLREVVPACANETGWSNLAKIGAQLRKQGIKYGKLSKFFEQYSFIETYIDESMNPPVTYARLKNMQNVKISGGHGGQEVKQEVKNSS